MFTKFFSWLLSPVLWTIVGIIAITLLVWFGSPFIAIADYRPFESVTARLVLLFALLTIWFGRRIYRAIRNKAASQKFLEALQRRPASDQPVSAMDADVKARFEKAMLVLREAQFGGKPSLLQRIKGAGTKQYIYQLPWYMFIGAPGSGKTTALLNAGLQFPLAEKLGNDPIRGVGGTRNCDWWFTDESVLIDTAGRYTTQDSDKSIDAKEWNDFLALLKKSRPRQPLNGVLVTISVSDLLHFNSGERDAQAAAIRARIQELRKTLNHHFPVYVLVTKADLLAGFNEYFGSLDKVGREQVLGVTFDFNENQEQPTFAPATFKDEFLKLCRNLSAKSFERLNEDRDPKNRVAIFGMAHQAASLTVPLQTFLEQAFSTSKLELPVQLRGVYLVSGTQQGSPMDRVLVGLARSFGFQTKVAAPSKPSGKAYFLHDLLKKVIFPEAPLAGTNLGWEKKLARIKWFAIGASSLAATVMVIGGTISFFNNRTYVDDVTVNASKLATELNTAAAQPNDLPNLLKLLANVRAIPTTATVSADTPPFNHRIGLFQGDKLNEASQQAYHRLLQSSLAPYVVSRIESVLRGTASPEVQYETLKVYLMLKEPTRLSPEDVKGWIAFDAEINANPPLSKEQQDELAKHAVALLGRNDLQASMRFDDKLIADVQTALNRTPFPQRVFNRVRLGAAQENLADFKISVAGGQSAALVFYRPSGASLNDGVAGLYTYNGYYKGFNKLLDDGIRKLATEEVWVLGVTNSENAKRANNPVSKQALTDEVKKLYLQEYANIWTKFLGDIAIVKSANLTQSLTTTQILSGPDSPLPRLVKGIVKEVTLTVRPDAVALATDKASDVVAGAKKNLLDLLGTKGNPNPSLGNGEVQKVEVIVDDRFVGLRRLVTATAAGQPVPIDQTIALLGELFQHFQSAEAAVKSGAPAPNGSVVIKVQSEAARLPDPVKTMLQSLVSAGEKQVQGEMRGAVGQQMAAAVGEPCTRAIAGRYPFTAGSNQDVLAQDFANVFAPAGVIDDFFQKNLAANVDIGTKPWRFRRVADQTSGESSAALAQFQRAAEIRSVFFSGGARTPSIRVELKILDIDPGLTEVTLDVDGQLVKQTRGSSTPLTVQWPGPKGSNQVRLQVVAADPLAPKGAGAVFSGPWALFRLIDQGQMDRSGGPERLKADFVIDGKPVTIEVTSTTVQNPFKLPELRTFRCPSKL